MFPQSRLKFPSRIRATPHSDNGPNRRLEQPRNVSIPHSGHPSFRQNVGSKSWGRGHRFPSRIRATPHSDQACSRTSMVPGCVSIPHSGHPSFRLLFMVLLNGLWCSFHPAFGPPLIQTMKVFNVVGQNRGFHPAFGPPLIQTSVYQLLHAALPQFPSRIRATPHSDLRSLTGRRPVKPVSIPHSGHPSFRPSASVTKSSSSGCFHPAFGPPLIQTMRTVWVKICTLSFHPAFGPPFIQTLYSTEWL